MAYVAAVALAALAEAVPYGVRFFSIFLELGFGVWCLRAERAAVNKVFNPLARKIFPAFSTGNNVSVTFLQKILVTTTGSG
jgi:hypothetical protein